MRTISPGHELPSRLALHQLFLSKDDKPASDGLRSVQLPPRIGGNRSGGCSDTGRIEKIRFVIAVNPSHHKIPFELADIHLPKR